MLCFTWQLLRPQAAHKFMPWRAEPLYEIAKWHDSQIGNCSRVAACETQHHLMAYLHGKEVRRQAASTSLLCRQLLQGVHNIMCPILCPQSGSSGNLETR